MKKVVFCTLSVEGIHCWQNCNIEEVSYLSYPHRHIFHFKCYVEVTHGDRDVEFIELKHHIQEYLHKTYWNERIRMMDFTDKSCEMLAEELIGGFGLCQCEVNEDNENGAILYDFER